MTAENGFSSEKDPDFRFFPVSDEETGRPGRLDTPFAFGNASEHEKYRFLPRRKTFRTVAEGF